MEFKNYILVSGSMEAYPVAYRLKREGKQVILAIVQNLKSCFMEEKDEENKRRLANFDGIVPKISVAKVLRNAEKMSQKDKDETFIFFDLNCLYRWSQAFLKAGFKNGNFFTKEDYELETDREKAKVFVEKNYPGISVAEHHDFTKIEDAKKFLEDNSDKFWCLKGDSDHGAATVVPKAKTVEANHAKLVEAMEKDPKSYEAGGFILEELIVDPMEVTPAAFFYNGELVFLDIDIENKPIGAGNIGYQVGAAQTLIAPLHKKSHLAEIAFPPAIFKMAKKRTGMFNIDCSLLIDRKSGKMYFGEFCTRPGYDSLYAELAMARSVSGFFEDLADGKNPLLREFGVAVRLFNLPRKAPYLCPPDALRNMEVDLRCDEGIWPFDLRKEGDKFVTGGYTTDAAVACGYGKSATEAVNMAYCNISNYGLLDVYYRPEKDFLDNYKTSIMERWERIKGMSEEQIGIPEIIKS